MNTAFFLFMFLQGWGFDQRLQGSTSSGGQVIKTDSSVSYRVNENLKAYVGLPIYFVRQASTTLTDAGRPYFGFTVGNTSPVLFYSSNVMVTVPTDGPAVVDWSNYFSKSFTRVTPFTSIGASNPAGAVAHFEAGALLHAAPIVDFGASGYADRGGREEQTETRVVDRQGGRGRRPVQVVQETHTVRGTANDQGVSAWVTVTPREAVSFELGFNRSMRYDLNSLFFGIGFRMGNQ